MNPATLTIELNVECPHCEEYIDLLSPEMEMNDEGEMIRQAIPRDGAWSDAHRDFKEQVKCPACLKSFEVVGIEW